MPKKARKNLRLLVVGGSGRMGQALRAAASEHAVDIVMSVDAAGDWAKVVADEIDLVVDFSTPKGLAVAVKFCARHKLPLVSGTTGIGSAQMKSLVRLARQVPVLYSANMSLGVAVMRSALRLLGAVAEWDFQIEEIHHVHKKDRPSGTALMLQAALEEAIGRQPPRPLSVRGGRVPGTHRVMALGQDESLQFEHIAYDRKVFARGALRAARWLFDKGHRGLYDLSDLYEVK